MNINLENVKTAIAKLLEHMVDANYRYGVVTIHTNNEVSAEFSDTETRALIFQFNRYQPLAEIKIEKPSDLAEELDKYKAKYYSDLMKGLKYHYENLAAKYA